MAQDPEQTAAQLTMVAARLEQLARSQRDGPLGALKPFVLGALARAGTALRYAPQAGEQTRPLLRRNAGELQASATQGAQTVKGKIQGGTATAQDPVQAALTQVGDKVQAAADRAAHKAAPLQPGRTLPSP